MVTTLVIASTLFVAQPAALADLFEARKYHYGERDQQHLLPYHLFVPRSFEPTNRYPLLVWLNWKGHRDEQFVHLELVIDDPEHIEKYRFFILALPNWGARDGVANCCVDGSVLALEILRKTVHEYPVDEDRVYLTGLSAGGGRCWEMAMRYPELFAAVTPMASGGGDVSRVAKLVNIPIWAFHNLHDRLTPPVGDQETVAALKSAGGNVHLTFPDSGSHDCYTEAFQSYDIMEWMLAQRRGALCWTPPGCDPWQWWHILTLPGALLVFVRLTWCIEQRRRRKPSRVAVASETETTDADFCIGPLVPGGETTASIVEGLEGPEGVGTKIG